jgi:hypothetical protein
LLSGVDGDDFYGDEDDEYDGFYDDEEEVIAVLASVAREPRLTSCVGRASTATAARFTRTNTKKAKKASTTTTKKATSTTRPAATSSILIRTLPMPTPPISRRAAICLISAPSCLPPTTLPNHSSTLDNIHCTRFNTKKQS